ncbi:MAG: class I SAM-dependent methyltransferase [Pirellulaceae bacterium]|nr:class I SAM-dependent methyltransferase [Pirellulaceae bacterium]
MKLLENTLLRAGQIRSIEGTPCFDEQVIETFLQAPYDPLTSFEGPPNYSLQRGGRGKDHPRYGRFVYALARHYQPDYVVEVGTFAGGTAVGFANALIENGHGRLLCIDQDSYSHGTFPEVVQRNLQRVGLPSEQLQLCCGDSKTWLPDLANDLSEKVGIVLIDGDHTFAGARTDIQNALPLVKPGGLILVHDVDRGRSMDEATEAHPHPVYEAFHSVVQEQHLDWCILKFIRKHLGIIRVGRSPSQTKQSVA